MTASLPFTFTNLVHFTSILTSAVVTGLATVNFGVLSIWINTSAGALTLVYHITIVVLNWRRNTSISALRQRGISSEQNAIYTADVKMPTTPSPTYLPPPYESIVPNRRPISLLSKKSKRPAINVGASMPSGPFYSLLSLLIIALLEILTIVGFGMTVEVSINGALSILPAERATGMTFPWNKKIQKAQCTFLGVLMLLGLVVIISCVKGRLAISRLEDERREEIEYGFASPDSTHHPVTDWDSYGV